jgi:hypothetical protein
VPRTRTGVPSAQAGPEPSTRGKKSVAVTGARKAVASDQAATARILDSFNMDVSSLLAGRKTR